MVSIKKKAIIIFFVILVCGVAMILWRNIPHNIDVEYKGIQYDIGTETNEEVNIKINGKLNRDMRNNYVFEGKIVIDSLDFTKEYDTLPVIFDRDIMNGTGFLVYSTIVNGEPILLMAGTIRSNDNFSAVYITTNKAESNYELIIAAPARNLEEFNNIKKEMGK